MKKEKSKFGKYFLITIYVLLLVSFVNIRLTNSVYWLELIVDIGRTMGAYYSSTLLFKTLE